MVFITTQRLFSLSGPVYMLYILILTSINYPALSNLRLPAWRAGKHTEKLPSFPFSLPDPPHLLDRWAHITPHPPRLCRIPILFPIPAHVIAGGNHACASLSLSTMVPNLPSATHWKCKSSGNLQQSWESSAKGKMSWQTKGFCQPQRDLDIFWWLVHLCQNGGFIYIEGSVKTLTAVW